MQEYIKKFSVDDVQMYREQNEDPDFAVVEIYALAEGNNTHKNPFSREVLERDADTFKGKFIIGKYDKFTKDTESHEIEQSVLGYVPPNEEVEFRMKEVDGVEKEFVVVKGLLSKIYAKDVVDMFRSKNERTVSCEFSCSTEYDENEYGKAVDEFGVELNIDNPVLSYHIHGITVLGLHYNPSVAGTEIKVKQFAEESLQSHPVDKSKEAVDMGDWNGNKAKDDLLKEKNFKTVAKSVCLLLEDGWEEKRKGSLKYPVMNLKDGKWVYNAEGLSSARAYGEQHDSSVAEKAISIQKRLGLYKDDKEDTMSSEKKFAIDIGNLWSTIYDILVTKYPDDDYGSIYRIEGIYEEGTQKFAVIYRKDETTMYKLNITIENDNIVLGEDIVEVEKTYVEQGNVKKFSDENIDNKYKLFTDTEKDVVMEEKEKNKEMAQDNKEEQPKEEETKEMGCDETKAMADEESKEEVKEEKSQEEEKKFSLDAYVDQVAMLAMLEKETEQNKELAEKVMKQMSANEIVEKFIQMSKENAELKVEKEANDTEKRDKKFSAIMASVKEDLDEKKFSELSEEGKNLSLGELGAFENKVKAFAYEATKNKPKQDDDGIMRFAGVSESLNNQVTEDVFDRISKM
jgi:hypothetical protein|nr:MAG TPA: hypothetical protein [Caudoviricetes sp.]